jgi:hypothetical protein
MFSERIAPLARAVCFLQKGSSTRSPNIERLPMAVARLQERMRSLFPVRTMAVPVTDAFRASLYIWNAEVQRYSLYRGADASITSQDLKRLSEAGITTVYFTGPEYRLFHDYLRSSLVTILKDESLPVLHRFGALNEVIRNDVARTFETGNVPRAVENAGQFAHYIADLVCRDDFIATELGGLLNFDYGTSTHSANVTCFSVLLAKSLGYTDRAVLSAIGTGALLHDIGKVELPESIVQKQGALTRQEQEIVKRHPAAGLSKLRDRDGLEFGQLMMVYQHHERLDGSGYPVGVRGDEIHDWARICAIADVFEALTSQRPYRARYSVAQALIVMQENGGGGLDPEFLRCWQMIIADN